MNISDKILNLISKLLFGENDDDHPVRTDPGQNRISLSQNEESTFDKVTINSDGVTNMAKVYKGNSA